MNSIKVKGMLFSLIIIIISLFVLGITAYYNEKNNIENEVNHAILRNAEESAEHLSYFLDNYLSPLKEIANNEQVKTMDWVAQREILSNQINSNYEDIAVVSLDGITRYLDGTVLDLSSRDYIKSAFLDKTTLSEVLISKKSGEHVIMLAVPIKKDNVVVGALIARLKVDFLSQFVTPEANEKNESAFLISNLGSFISQSTGDSTSYFNLYELANSNSDYRELCDFMETNKQKETGYGEYRIRGQAYVVGFAVIPNTTWKIYIGMNTQKAFSGLLKLQEIFIGGIIAGFILCFLLAHYLVGKFMKPIIELEELFQKGAKGDFTIRFKSKSNDEIGRLGLSFNNMMDKIKTLTQFDPLTALLNQYVLEREVELLMNQEVGEEYSLIMLSMDNFRYINETYGYKIGDSILCEISDRISKQADGKCNLYRYKGDEFVVIRYSSDYEATKRFANRLLKSFVESFTMEDKVIEIGISIGIYNWSLELSGEDPLKAAAHVKNYAKSRGGNQIQIFDKNIQSLMVSRYELQKDIAEAIRTDQFFLLYQPLFYLKNEKISKMEALIRWKHPQRGLVFPDEFIEAAEQSGQIVEIDMWVFESVCKMLKNRKERKKPLIITSVNITASTFEEDNFIDRLKNILEFYKIDPSLIQFEITERMVITNVEESIAKLNQLKTMGISVSIDDFGIGYSSLSYIIRLPIDSIKIDRSFVGDLETSKEAKAIVTTIINFCKTLNLSVVAEGIEKQSELEYLKDNMCDIGQGYYFSKPITEDLLEQFFK